MFSSLARKTYFVCAGLTLGLMATQMGARIAMSSARAMALTPSAALLLKFLLYPEIAGSAILWVAMLYFWFTFDHSRLLKRGLWFPFILLFIPVTLVLYYALVYRRAAAAEVATPSCVAASAR